MHAEVYSDGVGEITVSGTVVRVDLVSLSPTERDTSNNPKSVFRQRLIFSVEGFANSLQVMHKALQGLMDAGMIKRAEPNLVAEEPVIDKLRLAEAPLTDKLRLVTDTAVAERPRPPNVSPNFR
jgi:hypothetical protein